MRFARRSICFAMWLCSLCSYGQELKANTSFPSPLSSIQVVVRIDHRNSPAEAVRKEELAVVAGGAPAKVEEIRFLKNEPILFVVAVDMSGSNRQRMQSVRAVTAQVFESMARDEDKGYLAMFSEKNACQLSTHPVSAEQVRVTMEHSVPKGGTALYDAVSRIVRERLSSAAGARETRKVLILISDGFDNSSSATREHAIEIAQMEGVQVFAITLPDEDVSTAVLGNEIDPQLRVVAESRSNVKDLRYLSQATGGRYVNWDSPKKGASQLIEAIDDLYLLTFTPAHANLKSEPLMVKGRGKFKVTAPTNYFRP